MPAYVKHSDNLTNLYRRIEPTDHNSTHSKLINISSSSSVPYELKHNQYSTVQYAPNKIFSTQNSPTTFSSGWWLGVVTRKFVRLVALEFLSCIFTQDQAFPMGLRSGLLLDVGLLLDLGGDDLGLVTLCFILQKVGWTMLLHEKIQLLVQGFSGTSPRSSSPPSQATPGSPFPSS